MPMYWNYPQATPGMWLWMALMSVIWLAVIVGVVALIMSALRRVRAPFTRQTPQDILAERYARGEIDAESYAAMRKQLGASEREHSVM